MSSVLLTSALLLQYAQSIRLHGYLNGIPASKELADRAVYAARRIDRGTIAPKSLKKWYYRVRDYHAGNPTLTPISGTLLYNTTSQQPYTTKGIEAATRINQAPIITDPEAIEHEIRKAVECPYRTRHLTKKAYHVLTAILQLKTETTSHYAATSSTLPVSVNIASVRAKGFDITWVVGVGKNGDNAHVHYLIRPLKNTNKTQMLKDLEPLKLNDSKGTKPTYLMPVCDFDSYAIYMAENYQEEAKPNILKRGSNRFGISNNITRLTKQQKKYTHPRYTRGEMERWEKATSIIRKKHNISFWGKRHWVYTYREEIREVAENLPIVYNYPLERVSNKTGIKSTLIPATTDGGTWTVYNNITRLYSLEVERRTNYNSSKYMLHYSDLEGILKEFEMPNIVEFNTREKGISLLCH